MINFGIMYAYGYILTNVVYNHMSPYYYVLSLIKIEPTRYFNWRFYVFGIMYAYDYILTNVVCNHVSPYKIIKLFFIFCPTVIWIRTVFCMLLIRPT